MADKKDDTPKNFTVYAGLKRKDYAQNCIDRVGADGIRTKALNLLDAKYLYRSRLGCPEVIVQAPDAEEDEEDAVYRGFITKATYFYFLSAVPQYTFLSPTLNHYGTEALPSKWYIRQKNYTLGVSTNYGVATKRQLTFSAPVPDLSFHDVAYIASKIYVVRTSAVGTISTVTHSPTNFSAGVPYVFPTSSGSEYGVDTSGTDADNRNFHVFSVGATHIDHVRGDKTAEDVGYNFSVEPSLPITASILKQSFGVNPTTNKVYMFGVAGIPVGGGYGSLYYFCQEATLSNTAPYVTTPALHLFNYDPRVGHDMDIAPSVDSWAGLSSYVPGFIPISSLGADLYFVEYALTNPGPQGTFGDIWTGPWNFESEVYGAVAADPTNTGKWTTLNNSQSEARTIPVFTQTGAVNMAQSYSMSVNWRYDQSEGNSRPVYSGGLNGGWVNDEDHCPTGGPAYHWFALQGELSPGDTFGTTSGNWEEERWTNTGQSSITHTLGDIEMLSYSATCSYNCDPYNGTVFSGWVRNTDMFLGNESSVYILKSCEGGPPSGAYFVATLIYGENNYLDAFTTTPYSNPKVISLTALSFLRCRDYIYHDKVNDVAIYLQVDGGGSETGNHMRIDLVVEARGVPHTVTLFENATSNRHGVTINHGYSDQIGPYISPQAWWPGYIDSPSLYAPICEQGDFAYIAYTTAAEEAAGVARRFTLSLPLYIRMAPRPVLLPDVFPPSTAYSFEAYNLTAGVRIAGDDVWNTLETTTFHIHVSHDGERDWLVDLEVKKNETETEPYVKGDADHHFAECYRI